MMSSLSSTDSMQTSLPTYQLCCCCLELVCRKSLWAEYEWMGETEVYGDMLKQCFNLIWPEPTMKEQICEVCITQLRNALHFKQKVMQGQNMIRTQLIVMTRTVKHGTLELGNNNNELFTQNVTMSEQINENISLDNSNHLETEELCDELFSQNVTMPDQIDEIVSLDNYDHLATEGLCDDPTLFNGGDVNGANLDIFVDPIKDASTAIDIQPKTTDVTSDPLASNDPKSDPPSPKKEKRKRKYYARKKRYLREKNYVKVRQNVCLILAHSTIVPFKSNKGYFNCLYCNKQFVGFEELKAHVEKIHENINYESIMKSILRPKDRIRADVSDMSCRICKKKIDNLKILITHLTDDHNVEFNDENEPNKCILAYELSDGMNKCYECKKEFLFYKTLTKHMNEHSTDYVCDICGRCFLLPERLRSHTVSHTIEKPRQCEICDRVYSTYLLYKSHVRHTHKKRSFICSICDKTFPCYMSRMKHLEEVHNRVPINLTCKFCGKTFSSPSCLMKHKKLDHLKTPKEAKYGCNVCGMMFRSQHSLKEHGIVHTGEKNFECKVCHKKYARAKTLKQHIKIHLNDRRWSCAVCSQAFVQKCSLKSHIRVHHGSVNDETLYVYKEPDVNKSSSLYVLFYFVATGR